MSMMSPIVSNAEYALSDPVTFERYREPVTIGSCGQSFEREDLIKALSFKSICPFCNEDVNGLKMIPNRSLKAVVDACQPETVPLTTIFLGMLNGGSIAVHTPKISEDLANMGVKILKTFFLQELTKHTTPEAIEENIIIPLRDRVGYIGTLKLKDALNLAEREHERNSRDAMNLLTSKRLDNLEATNEGLKTQLSSCQSTIHDVHQIAQEQQQIAGGMLAGGAFGVLAFSMGPCAVAVKTAEAASLLVCSVTPCCSSAVISTVLVGEYAVTGSVIGGAVVASAQKAVKFFNNSAASPQPLQTIQTVR